MGCQSSKQTCFDTIPRDSIHYLLDLTEAEKEAMYRPSSVCLEKLRYHVAHHNNTVSERDSVELTSDDTESETSI